MVPCMKHARRLGLPRLVPVVAGSLGLGDYPASIEPPALRPGVPLPVPKPRPAMLFLGPVGRKQGLIYLASLRIPLQERCTRHCCWH